MPPVPDQRPAAGHRRRLHQVIFQSDTRAGRLIDLLAIAPTYLSLLVPGAQSLIVVRVLRVLRVFRILKLTEYLRESRTLSDALYASRRKIGVFLLAVLSLIVIIGSLMYLIEGEENG